MNDDPDRGGHVADCLSVVLGDPPLLGGSLRLRWGGRVRALDERTDGHVSY